MSVRRIVSVVGARPQFIKAAVVSRALAQTGLHEVLLHTGQHFDANMSDVFFQELSLPQAAYNLGIGGGLHGAMTGEQLARIEEVLITDPPDLVLVYGDTNSTLAGALAAAKLQIPVAHVEAGLRSFNRRMPEELNRVMADHLSTLLFAPTSQSMTNLRREGIDAARCHCVGDVMFDAALQYRAVAAAKSTIIDRFGLTAGKFALLTVHRQENTDNLGRLQSIVAAAHRVAAHLPVVWPVHPRTKKTIAKLPAAEAPTSHLYQTDPVGYLDMLMLESNAAVIVTDSGGVQKEAFFFEIPCVTLREETEWTELVELDWNMLAPPTDVEGADRMASCILSRIGVRGRSATPYGAGKASQEIAAIISSACVSC